MSDTVIREIIDRVRGRRIVVKAESMDSNGDARSITINVYSSEGQPLVGSGQFLNASSIAAAVDAKSVCATLRVSTHHAAAIAANTHVLSRDTGTALGDVEYIMAPPTFDPSGPSLTNNYYGTSLIVRTDDTGVAKVTVAPAAAGGDVTAKVAIELLDADVALFIDCT